MCLFPMSLYYLLFVCRPERGKVVWIPLVPGGQGFWRQRAPNPSGFLQMPLNLMCWLILSLWKSICASLLGVQVEKVKSGKSELQTN